MSLIRLSSCKVDTFVKQLPSVVASKRQERDNLFMELFSLEWRVRSAIYGRDGWTSDMETVILELREGGHEFCQAWRIKVLAASRVHGEMCQLEDDLAKSIAHITAQIEICEDVAATLDNAERRGELPADVPSSGELRAQAESYRATLACARRYAKWLPSTRTKSLVPLCLVDVLRI
ncbi:hypothetical protein CYLTODRAFT_494870 [Cylindrobasidium torrendii FP15055 ss-10]|uniref:Uncharacterized protein n=1 Tax=Cylindrobasidium torrendii FP15055 ss-10 TaxID=1314674 RepID=A0A0D7AV51_9AGAR|nr:hypothetical protein CYLTODRAFT_494870 [Cylindrobasidium torrendii FP15055 ss-10]